MGRMEEQRKLGLAPRCCPSVAIGEWGIPAGGSMRWGCSRLGAVIGAALL